MKITPVIYLFSAALLLLISYCAPAQETGLDLPARSAEHNRIALVIGNGDYLSGPLKNTVNDARSVSRALHAAGFEVMLRENISNKDEMKRVIREFGMRMRRGGTALFYYAGHGMQVNGFNYLIPVNAVISIEQEVEYEAVDVGFVLAYMENVENSVNIVILDACRNNPFARSFRDARQGLVGMTAPAGTIIAYATAPGSVASDGDGVYGLYTSALLQQINTPGLKVEDVFKNVRRNVLRQSNGQQTPWESSSLVGDFYFYPEDAVVTAGENQEDDAGPVKTVQQAGEGKQEEMAGHLKPDGKGLHPESGSGKEQIEAPGDAVRQPPPSIPFRWRATADGTYYLEADGIEISRETTWDLRGEHLYVFHEKSGRLFVLKSFIYRQDGRWRKGKSR